MSFFPVQKLVLVNSHTPVPSVPSLPDQRTKPQFLTSTYCQENAYTATSLPQFKNSPAKKSFFPMENLSFQWSNQQQCSNIEKSLNSSADYNVIARILDLPDALLVNPNSANSSKLLISPQNHKEGTWSYDSTFQPSSLLQSANSRRDSGDDFFNLDGFLQREDGLTSVFSNSESIQNLNSGDSDDFFSCISSKDKDYLSNSHICFSDSVLQPNTTQVSSTIQFRHGIESVAKNKEMVYHAAVLRPINLGPEKPSLKPKRKNMRISSDPQTVAARQRRAKIGEKLSVADTSPWWKQVGHCING